MSFRLYKEGQGTWARGTLACLVGVTGLMAAVSVYDSLGRTQFGRNELFSLFGFSASGQVLLAALALVPFCFAGVWLYNHQRLSDFLIETESELRTKVTWPTRKDAFNNSIVVVITSVIMGLWIFLCDYVFAMLSQGIYGLN